MRPSIPPVECCEGVGCDAVVPMGTLSHLGECSDCEDSRNERAYERRCTDYEQGQGQDENSPAYRQAMIDAGRGRFLS